MIQYEKENTISLEDIVKEKEKFHNIQSYEIQLKNLPIEEDDVMAYISLFIGFCTFITMLSLNLENIFRPSFLILSFLVALVGFVGSFFALWFIDIIATDGFNIHLFGFLNKKQIKKINEAYLKENGKILDIKKETHNYYTYLIQKDVRLSLINEIDNTLLMATHYQMDDGNTSIDELKSLKKQYITFILSDNSEEDFIFINHKIISLLQNINHSIEQQANNQFYTDYIQVDSIKPEQKLKLLDTASKYRGIL